MSPDFPALLAYFEEVARDYASAIEPALGPLAEWLVDSAALRPGEYALDLGAGSGLVARAAARTCRTVVALDFSRRMASEARRMGVRLVVQGDMHALPLPARAFDVALAALAFNSTDPRRSLLEAQRVLKPGGRLAVLEWGAPDPLSDLVDDTLGEYAVDDPPPALAARLAEQRAPHPWDDLETAEDIVNAVREAGFRPVSGEQTAYTVTLPDAATFIRYKLAWPTRRAELEAMPDEVRALCLADLHENLEAHTAPDGHLRWEPNLVRVLATRPAR